MPSILFVCTANQFRSPIAAACMRRQLVAAGLAAEWTVESAGTWVVQGLPVPLDIQRALYPLGIDLGAHRPQGVSARLLERFDLVVVMTAGQKESISIEFPEASEKLFLLSQMAEGLEYDIPDPFKDKRNSLEASARELCRLVEMGFENICKQAGLARSQDS